MKGTVKWYNHSRGFGFITGEDGKDIFVHSTNLIMIADLNENDQVEYTSEESERGPKATNVKMLKNA
ncbi:MAG: cold shock domain-containing protein [Thermoplasmatota archaeon]|jgi:CspA family cold shock protein